MSDDKSILTRGGRKPAFFCARLRTIRAVRAGKKTKRMIAADRVAQLVEASIEDMGFELVRVQLSGGDQRQTLQIMAERADRGPMTVDHCADISRTVSALLDVEDPIDGAYTLEVSSPGIDRPLTKLEHFERFAGFEARVETHTAVDGRKRFRGVITGTDEDSLFIRIDDEDEARAVPITALQRAKLILTDELLAQAQAEQEMAELEAAEPDDSANDNDA